MLPNNQAQVYDENRHHEVVHERYEATRRQKLLAAPEDESGAQEQALQHLLKPSAKTELEAGVGQANEDERRRSRIALCCRLGAK